MILGIFVFIFGIILSIGSFLLGYNCGYTYGKSKGAKDSFDYCIKTLHREK